MTEEDEEFNRIEREAGMRKETVQERNFCERCGKRLGSGIHTCTPPAAQQEYERGFIDGMQRQAQSSVDKAVNAMSKRQWVGLTDEEIDGMVEVTDLSGAYYYDDLHAVARATEAKLKEKNEANKGEKCL